MPLLVAQMQACFKFLVLTNIAKEKVLKSNTHHPQNQRHQEINYLSNKKGLRSKTLSFWEGGPGGWYF